jgi:hypothetical protein
MDLNMCPRADRCECNKTFSQTQRTQNYKSDSNVMVVVMMHVDSGDKQLSEAGNAG